jgi:hypothetical protein
MSHWITRLVLVAALVISQALFAGHSLAHTNGDAPDCQICLQATNGVAALHSAERAPLASTGTNQPDFRRANPVLLAAFNNAHPSRAPPAFPV